MKKRTRSGIAAGLGVMAMVVGSLALPVQADAQYFGRNKVQYDKFDFKVLKTEHFDIYYYTAEADAAAIVGRMAERWYTRLSKVFGHTLTGRQPVVLYGSHPEFEQTTVIEGEISEGTGGVTEGAKRRVVLPTGASLAETDHVLGHELVHAFQYDILDRNAGGLPLWFIEGMAEYLSLGPRDSQTAMWLRDAAIEDKLPRFQDLDNPRFFPYRFGHAFWAYVTGRWGDAIIPRLMSALSPGGAPIIKPGTAEDATGFQAQVATTLTEMFEAIAGRKRDDLSREFQAAVRETYGVGPSPTPRRSTETGVIAERTGSGSMNVGPSLSPDGTKLAFLSERDRLSIDLYLADATTGKIIRKLISTATDPHFESLQFLASAGAWDAASRMLAVATVSGGQPELTVIDTSNGKVSREIKFPELGEIFQPAWAPDGNAIAFSAQVGGVTNLYVHDLKTSQTRQLTNDVYADLQPSWSPDGTRIAFVTDRYASDLEKLSFTGYGLAIMTVADASMTRLDTGLTGTATNPQFSRDGNTLFFLADTAGRRNLWKIDLATKATTQLSDELTGVAGITPLSPAISVATGTSRAAVNIFRNSAYEIHIIDPSVPLPPPPGPPLGVADAAILPPSVRKTNDVADLLKDTGTGLPPPETATTEPYKAGLSLSGMGQQIGVSTNSTFGTYVSGGVVLEFTDVLGNHILGTGFSVNGGVRDIAATVTYLNRTSRWNWGLFGERVPLLSGTVRSGFDVVNNTPVFVEQTILQRQTYSQIGAMTAYPLSRATRIEFNSAVRQIGFTNEVQNRYYDPNSGAFLGNDKTDLASEPAINLVDAGAAFVRDTSVFGATSPVLGQRLRLEVSPTFGDLKMTTLNLDVRQYFMPVKPLTFAVRALHVARYGVSSEDQRLSPMFLGYSTLIRGYDPNSFQASECTPQLDGSCPEFDRLFGSRMFVVNAEIRAPLKGLFNGRLDYGPVPVELIGFYDGGVAWTKDIRPSFRDGPQSWVGSAGVGARVNLFGYAIGEFNLAHPLTREGRGWFFVFNLRPGF